MAIRANGSSLCGERWELWIRRAALDVRPIMEANAGAIWPLDVASACLVSLAALSLILALIGLYASVSYALGRRTREMGIRAALDATPSHILDAALYDTASLLGIGAPAGLGFAIAAAIGSSYSYLNARIGSSLAARRAGTTQANSVTSARSTAVPSQIAGSRGLRP
jgi:hypothetical protein